MTKEELLHLKESCTIVGDVDETSPFGTYFAEDTNFFAVLGKDLLGGTFTAVFAPAFISEDGIPLPYCKVDNYEEGMSFLVIYDIGDYGEIFRMKDPTVDKIKDLMDYLSNIISHELNRKKIVSVCEESKFRY